jgi:glycosyltransferase involved in cell wall biosynthesis
MIYHIWPHYREALIDALQRSDRVAYSFYGSGEPYLGIPHARSDRFRIFVHAPFRLYGRILWQPAAIKAALSNDYDAIVYLADPNFASTWIGAIIARLRGIPVLFWAHGWRQRERPVKRKIRNLFFNLADRLFVYAERGKQLGEEAGYPAEKISVVYNSLDVDYADNIIRRIETGELRERPQNLFAEPARPLLICTARLTPACQFDLLLEAASSLMAGGRPVNILLVGDGPDRDRLERMARQRGLSVHFYGACFEETVLGQFIYHADLTVSPGKIGLTAMHSLMYGTPAITHGNLDQQMPEVEAVEIGRTGLLFEQNDPQSLADAIAAWLDSAPDRDAVRDAARAVVHEKWNPARQAAIIEQAIGEEVERKRGGRSAGR